MLNFIRPAQSRLIVSLAQAAWPLYARIRYHGMRLEIDKEVLERFEAIRGNAAIICANHSAEEDPDVLFGLSNRIHEKFYFLTAREIFGDSRSLISKWLQKLGCFSVERGLADINAFKAIKELLLGGARIVMFPEGEISRHNDIVMDLENGPEHIALSALAGIQSQDPKASVFIIPLGLKYRYDRRARPNLEGHLTKLERLLGRQARTGESIRIRLEKSFDVLLARLEKQYSCHSDKGSRLGERWRLLRESIILRCATFLGMNQSDAAPQLRRIHILKIRLRQWEHGHQKSILGLKFLDTTEYKSAERCRQDLVLATVLTNIGEHSFDHRLNQEESAELIAILEQALSRRNTMLRPSTVSIGAGNTIDVRQFSTLYAASKQKGISTLKAHLRNEIVTALLKLENQPPEALPELNTLRG